MKLNTCIWLYSLSYVLVNEAYYNIKEGLYSKEPVLVVLLLNFIFFTELVEIAVGSVISFWYHFNFFTAMDMLPIYLLFFLFTMKVYIYYT